MFGLVSGIHSAPVFVFEPYNIILYPVAFPLNLDDFKKLGSRILHPINLSSWNECALIDGQHEHLIVEGHISPTAHDNSLHLSISTVRESASEQFYP